MCSNKMYVKPCKYYIITNILILLISCSPINKDEKSTPYYYGHWYYWDDDSVYSEFILNDSLIIFLNDSFEVYKQDVIDDIIYFIERKNGNAKRIFYGIPKKVNDSVVYLTSDTYVKFNFPIYRINKSELNSFYLNMDKIVRSYQKRKINYESSSVPVGLQPTGKQKNKAANK